MNKTTQMFMFYILAASLALLALNGCSAFYPNITPALATTMATPPYSRFSPSEDSNIHLEFDYPSGWIFEQDLQYPTLMIISFGDPRFRTLPTPSSEASRYASSDFGRLVILISSIDPEQSLDVEAEMYKQNNNGFNGVAFQSDYTISIDGYNARVLEYTIEPGEAYSSRMFERRITFIVKDQMYKIFFTISEKDRGGEFEQGYDYFFNSLKIVP